MTSETRSPDRSSIHPVHAVLLASSLPLFLGAMLSDWAYSSTYQNQWAHFASWLNAGALMFVGAALLWAAINFFRADIAKDRAGALYILVLLATFTVGFINALVHAKDGWATMPEGFILSLVTLILALVAIWLGFSTRRTGANR